MAPGESGHIAVHFKEKGGRAGKMLHLHAGHGAIGDMIETEKDASPYRVSLVGGKMHFKGLPDLSEDFNYCYECEMENLLVFRLFKKKDNTILKGTLGGLALAGAVIGGHKLATQPTTKAAPTAMRTSVTPAAAKIGSGQVKSQVERKAPNEVELAGPFIREREAFRDKAYRLGDKKNTVGYGTTVWSTGKPVQMGDTITREQAEKEHDNYINTQIMPQMQKTKFWGGLNPNQRAAVISFSYNHGAYWHTKPEYQPLVSALMTPDNHKGVTDAWYRFAHSSANPTLDKGLRNRAESELQFGGWGQPKPVEPKDKNH
jgi:GH24 family phage-related lysozyme (muramidase)